MTDVSTVLTAVAATPARSPPSELPLVLCPLGFRSGQPPLGALPGGVS